MQKALQSTDGHFEVVDTGQGHDAEVIRLFPVKTGAMYEQYFFLLEKVQRHSLVINDIEFFLIQFREQVQCPFGFYAGNARDRSYHVIGFVALFEQSSAWQDKLVDTLVTAECRLDGMLHRYIGAQAH